MRQIDIGDTLGGYRIEALIGHGGMGVVYRATQLRLSRTVALKVIMPALATDLEFRARFESESRIAASIDHNHVVPIYEADEIDQLLFIIMRYVDGQDLGSLVSSEGALQPRRAARIMAQVGAALDAAHSRGLVHRDVKPGNILITGQAGDEHAYLTDFGLTKNMADQGLTKTGQWVGTLDYAAPEQIDGRPVDARTDVYALGCVLFQSLTGQVPFVRDSDVAKMYAHLHDPAPRVDEVRAEVPEPMCEVVARAMAKDPEERFPSAGDFGRAAVAAASGDAKDLPERSVAVGGAAPAGLTRASEKPPAPATTPAQPPADQQPTPPFTPVPEPLAPQPAPVARQPAPVAAQPAPVAPTPLATPQFQAPPPAAQIPPQSQPQSPPPGNRGLLMAVVALLAVLVLGGGAYALISAGKDDEPKTSTTVADSPTPTAPPGETATAAPTETSAPEQTDTPAPPVPGGPCENRFISATERSQLSNAHNTNEAALQGSVFYGVCEGQTYALATFPDGSDGVFQRVRNSYWYEFGSFRKFRCRVPNQLLTIWKQATCIGGE